MELTEFRRTRVTMTVEQYAALYDGDFDVINKETAKMHVYKDGIYLRETLNGFLHNDLGVEQATCSDIETMEEYFWKDYANDFYNPKPELSELGKNLLKKFKTASSVLNEYWIEASDEEKELLEEHYPIPLPSFDDLNNLIGYWVKTTLKMTRDEGME